MSTLQKIQQLYQLPEEANFGFSADEIAALEKSLGLALPVALKHYYLNLGKNESINTSHNQLLKPATEVGFSEDRYLMIFEENQGVVSWGIKEEDLAQENPPVWGNYGTEEEPDWYVEASTTENFFLLMAVYNGTFGGLKYNANFFGEVDPQTVKRIENTWTLVPEISYEKQQVYADDFKEVISVCFDDDQRCSAIFIGTSDQQRFDETLDLIAVDWSYTSYEDEDEEWEED
ncbi:hypothetical protein [Pedobacter xixiisoli]|uniref:Knr4/Smi1-like domain-containing protein n=1 Tax=Pedobacter xixiisoli TaxID=1476464 RepID=A0A285ZZN6_9SPHI|nr:hypothetical protein [Pedobacter xixiisoli]SOD15112.1 hypothetical protein SAMN06297358_2087 [Pedobacter xixiisoli]